MSQHTLAQLKAETTAALNGLFVVNSEALKSYEKGYYFSLFALPSKRVRSILGAEREVLILGNTFQDQQPRSIQFAQKLIAESSGRLETSLCIIVHQDPKGNSKLKNWGREKGIVVLPIYTPSYDGELTVAAGALQKALLAFDKPVILAFDEIDYITPGNSTCPQWKQGFIEFWRNIRAGYHAAARENRIVSLLISGVSSRWFSVESIDGIENAALAFVPEEYLSPLPRGAAEAMIKNIGSMAGLKFDDKALSAICTYCSDMPFWIRKACSFIHARVETAARPLTLSNEQVTALLDDFVRDQGGSLALVALQHLFRVYPELRDPAQALLSDRESVSPRAIRILGRYGITNGKDDISGVMMEQALKLLAEGDLFGRPLSEISDESLDFDNRLPISEWAEELAGINMRRNLLERSLRAFTVNFLRADALTKKTTAKALLLAGLPEHRKRELDALNVEAISGSLTWRELVSIIEKNWVVFERVFGDKSQFALQADIINDRPDAHAKGLELGDIAMHRR